MMRDLIGQQLGNYQLVRFLGHGGFAEVYLGQHVRLSKQAAIKVLHAHLSDEQVKVGLILAAQQKPSTKIPLPVTASYDYFTVTCP